MIGISHNLTYNAGTNFHNLSHLRRMKEISRNISWEEDEDYFVFDDPRLQTALLVLYSLVFCFCFLGNLMVVLVTNLHWKMRGVTKFCLGNLAFANLCVSIFCIYQNLSLYLMDTWIFGDVMCKMYHFINSLSHTASILILVVIAVERYLAILHPFKSRRIMTMKRLRIIIVGVWVVSALICSPRLYFIIIIKNMLRGSKGEPPTYEVICSIGSSLFDSRVTDWIQFILLFFLPLLVITVLYARIAHTLNQRQIPGRSFSRTIRELPTHKISIGNDSLENSDEIETSTQIFDETENSDENCSENLTENYNLLCSENNESPPERGKTVQKRSIKNLWRIFKSAFVKIKLKEANLDLDIKPGGERVLSKITNNTHKVSHKFTLGCCGRSRVFRRNAVKRRPGERRFNNDLAVARRHAKVVRMLVLIVVTFAICNLPFYLRKLYQHHLYAQRMDSVLTELSAPFTFLLMYANCAINPFLYAFMSKGFRSCTFDLVKCKLRKPSPLK